MAIIKLTIFHPKKNALAISVSITSQRKVSVILSYFRKEITTSTLLPTQWHCQFLFSDIGSHDVTREQYISLCIPILLLNRNDISTLIVIF